MPISVFKQVLLIVLGLFPLASFGYSQSAEGDSVIAITHIKVFDGKGNPAKKDQTILIKNGKILTTGDFDKVKIPSKANIIDSQGKTAVPSLIMVHEHMFYPSPAPGQPHVNQMEYSFPRLYLAAGVTSIRTAGSIEPYSDINIKNWIDSGKIPGPNIHLTSPYIEGSDGFLTQFHSVSGPEEVREMVRYWVGQGMTSFKAYTSLTTQELNALIAEAHQHNSQVTGHLCSVTYREAAELGIDNLEHGFYVMTDFVKDKEKDKCPANSLQRKSILSLNTQSEEVQDLISFLIEKK